MKNFFHKNVDALELLSVAKGLNIGFLSKKTLKKVLAIKIIICYILGVKYQRDKIKGGNNFENKNKIISRVAYSFCNYYSVN